MKYTTFILLSVGMLFSCKSDEIGPKPVEKIIKYKGLMALPNGGLSFVGLSDGRCPRNDSISCFSAGSVTVDLELIATQDTSQIRQVKMCLGDCQYALNPKYSIEDTVLFSLSNVNYKLILLEVNPYPTRTDAQAEKYKKDYTIKLKIQTTP